MERKVNNNWQEKKEKKRHLASLTPYQLSQLILFPEKGKNFAALGGLLDPEEQNLLKELSGELSRSDSHVSSIEVDKTNPLRSVSQLNGDPQIGEILEKIAPFVRVRIITSKDIATVGDFTELPPLVKLTFTQAGDGLLDQIDKFLEKGGIMVLTFFKKPAPAYLQAIERMRKEEGLIIEAAIVKALISPPDAVEKASHQFLTVNFIPPEDYNPDPRLPGNPAHLNLIINRRLDKNVERNLAKLTLLQAILSSESKGIFQLIALGSVAIGAFELAEIILRNPELQPHLSSFLPPILFSLHFFNKFFFPLLSDMMSFYGQLKPWLKGKNFYQEIDDMLRRYIFSNESTHKESALFSIAANFMAALGGQSVKEIFGNLPGAVVFNLLPFLVAVSSSFQTVKATQRITGTNFSEAVKETIRNNPYQLAAMTGAVATTASGTYLMGIEGKFDDPLVVGVVHGFLEHIVAALIATIQLIFLPHNFNRWAKNETAVWIKKTYSRYLRRKNIF